MSVVLNPRDISWEDPSAYVDGSAFGAADFAGYEFAYRPTGSAQEYTPAVAVPVSFGQRKLDLSLLGLPQTVDLDVAMRTVAKNGAKSAFTNPVQVRFDTRVPRPPINLALS
jgi:hypothetical protein